VDPGQSLLSEGAVPHIFSPWLHVAAPSMFVSGSCGKVHAVRRPRGGARHSCCRCPFAFVLLPSACCLRLSALRAGGVKGPASTGGADFAGAFRDMMQETVLGFAGKAATKFETMNLGERLEELGLTAWFPDEVRGTCVACVQWSMFSIFPSCCRDGLKKTHVAS
jgi:hypothetical protein